MIFLHKIFPTLVLPIMLVIIGFIKNNKNLIYLTIGILYLISIPIIFSNKFFKLVEGSKYKKNINTIDTVDAILVLSGIITINEVGNSTYLDWGDPDRFFGEIDLFKARKAQKLILTGSKMPWHLIKQKDKY
jgi:hypothetical protein